MISIIVSLWEKQTRLEDEVQNAASNMGGQKLTCDRAGKGGPSLTKIGVDFPTINKALKFMKKMLEKDIDVEAGLYWKNRNRILHEKTGAGL